MNSRNNDVICSNNRLILRLSMLGLETSFFPNLFSMHLSNRKYGGNLLLVTLLSHYCFKSSTNWVGHISANTTPQRLQWEDQVMGLAVSYKRGYLGGMPPSSSKFYNP